VNRASFATPEAFALAERGKYLFMSTSCVYCHGPTGRGGHKVNCPGMGTVWTRNISQDFATGIGSWTDEEIARAIRSGVTADGRTMFLQFMPWDHFSNLDEEDVRALVAFLRVLPPVSHQIPDPQPASPDDCNVYTFFLSDSNFTPGCR
jgi:cytochrome c553